MSMRRKFLFLLIASLLAAAIINFGHYYSLWAINPTALSLTRWIPIGLLIWHAVRSKSLTTWILVCMVAGAEFGEDFPVIAIHLNLMSKIFLNMVKTIISPLIFATLVVGIAGHSNLKQVGRMGWKSIVYFEIISTIALFVGLLVINISQAGVGVSLPSNLVQDSLSAVKPGTWDEVILHIFPENIAKSIYEGQILQVVIFSIVFGIAVAMLKEHHRKRMINFTESLSETMFKFTNVVMYLAPLAVFAAIAYTVGSMGLGILNNLIKLLASLYAAFFLFLIGVLLPVAYILKIPVKKFILAITEPATIAFATTSSESALPRAMEAMEKFGVPRKIVAFVMPTGYSFNLDGTTLYLSLATIFVAQVSGIYIPLTQQLIIVFTLMLTSKGAAGVPRAALVILLGTAASFGLPSWPIFIILGIDILMDMGRSAINVTGNCLAAAVIARWEGEFDDKKARNFNTGKIE
jgi:proton glutamate symport protein